jgi:UDP-N-acetylmuramate dehydrogenase
MSIILQNVSLKPYNTFGIEATAKYFAEANTVDDLFDIFKTKAIQTEQLLVLGGGSNCLFTQDFNGLVVKMSIGGIDYVLEDDHILLTAGAGVVWNDLVNYCVRNGFAGIENLALIPGTVGASPIQNIGAYGVELKDVFSSCKAFEIATGQIKTFDFADCNFGYRDSVFKNELKGKYIITQVYFRLSKKINLNTTYGAIETELKSKGIEHPTIKDVSDAVISIRRSKLPDPTQIGNAGSFFKNPVVETAVFEKIKSEYPTVPSYPVSAGHVKMPAGWLIETAGWKGKTIDNYGVHKLQALVLVNYGGATGVQLFDLSTAILKDVFDKFGILLDREVNII